MKKIFEIAIGMFAGYSCTYFLSMKLMRKTPEEIIEEFLKVIKEKYSR